MIFLSYLAGDLGYDPSHPVLETDALADYANPRGAPPWD